MYIKHTIAINKYYDCIQNEFISEISSKEMEYILREIVPAIAEKIGHLLGITEKTFSNNILYQIHDIKIVLEPTKEKESKYKVDVAEIIRILNDTKTPILKKIREEYSNIFNRISENESSESEFKSTLKEHLHRIDEESTEYEKSKIHLYIANEYVLGEFYEKGKGEIVLYLKTICESNDPNEQLMQTFIHELFHAYHYFATNKKFNDSWGYKPYQHSVVKEGLASYVEISLSSSLLGNERRNFLIGQEMKYYPYAAYKNIEYKEHTDINIVSKIFRTSLVDIGDAYNMLVAINNEMNQHQISNKIQHINEYINNYSRTLPEYRFDFIATSKVIDDISKNHENFSEHLRKVLAEKGISDPECYKAANISKGAFNKIINGVTVPNKNNVALLSIALRLDSEEYNNFIRKAGYGRSTDKKDPLNIVGYFIDHKEYDLLEIENIVKEMTGKYLCYYGD